MTRETAIEVRNVSKRFGDFQALDDVSFTIGENEFFTLLGPSGCGKTTLLRMVAGFESPTEGSILLFGGAIDALPAHKRRVNTVFQSYALFPHMSLAQNVAFGLENLGWPRRSARRGSPRCWRWCIMTPFAGRRPRSSPAGSGSGSRSPGRWRRSRRCCCSTSRCRRSTSSSGRRCATSSEPAAQHRHHLRLRHP